MQEELNFIGVSEIDQVFRPIGLLPEDRRRHAYIVGKSGMGKSTLMENMILQDILAGRGVGFIDPLGDSALNIIDKIPSHRLKDVVYFNPSDIEYPVGINILEAKTEEEIFLVASNILSVMQKIWAGTWSSRMEYILLNTILALLETPGNNLLGVVKMFLDKDFRKYIADNTKNLTVKVFWQDEYPRFSASYANEAVAAIQNKVGQFFANEMVRNIIGSLHSTINIRQIMDEGKIFIANLARGKVGESNASLLGGLIMTQFELAAMSRIDTPENDRRDFYLYIDEFHDLITPSFNTILSQARKYHLNMVFANQYLGQLTKDRENDVLKAIFGNVGTVISFQTSVEDSELLSAEMMPVPPEYFPKLNQGQAYCKLYVAGDNLSGTFLSTLPPLFDEFRSSSDKVIAWSRSQYSRPRAVAKAEIEKYFLSSVITDTSGSEVKAKKSRKRNRKPKSDQPSNQTQSNPKPQLG